MKAKKFKLKKMDAKGKDYAGISGISSDHFKAIEVQINEIFEKKENDDIPFSFIKLVELMKKDEAVLRWIAVVFTDHHLDNIAELKKLTLIIEKIESIKKAQKEKHDKKWYVKAKNKVKSFFASIDFTSWIKP